MANIQQSNCTNSHKELKWFNGCHDEMMGDNTLAHEWEISKLKTNITINSTVYLAAHKSH